MGLTRRAVTCCNSCPTFTESTASLLFLSVHKQSYFSSNVRSAVGKELRDCVNRHYEPVKFL